MTADDADRGPQMDTDDADRGPQINLISQIAQINFGLFGFLALNKRICSNCNFDHRLN